MLRKQEVLHCKPMTRTRSLILLWLITDIILFVGSFALAYFFRVGFIFSTDFPFQDYIAIVSLVSPVWLLSLVSTHSFTITRNQKHPRIGMRIVFSSLLATALFALAYYFVYGLFFSRMLLLVACILSPALVWIWHIVFQHILRTMLRREPASFPTLIVGATREAEKLIKTLNAQKSPLKPVAILDGRGTKLTEMDNVPVKGKLNKLEDVLKEDRITHIIQCSDLEQTVNLVSLCRNRGIQYLLLPSVLGMISGDERVDLLEGMPMTIVQPQKNIWKHFFV